METILKEVLFPGDGNIRDVNIKISDGMSEDGCELLIQLVEGGYYDGESLDISRFLTEDSLLDLALYLDALEVVEEHLSLTTNIEPTLYISNIDKFLAQREGRGGELDEKQFILQIANAVCNSTVVPIKVAYKEHNDS